MAFDKDAFLTELDSMTVMDLNDLVKAIEEKFGVSAAAMAAPAGILNLLIFYSIYSFGLVHSTSGSHSV